ncbi:hypothetical protein ASPCADRAFT_204129, partial [Aspergillus carbonarius ITEM 5010]
DSDGRAAAAAAAAAIRTPPRCTRIDRATASIPARRTDIPQRVNRAGPILADGEPGHGNR